MGRNYGTDIGDRRTGVAADILDRRHRDLLNEISHTDHREFKQELRKEERLLDSLSRVRGTAVQEFHV